MPSKDCLCPAIFRVEGGALGEIGDAFCSILSDYALPAGSILLIGSMSHLRAVGLAKYTERVIHEVNRFNSMFKGSVTTIPFAPMPLCGVPDPATVSCLYNLSLWLDSILSYPLTEYNLALRNFMDACPGPAFPHCPRRVFLPTCLDDYKTVMFELQGWQGLPEKIEPISSDSEETLLPPLLKGLSCIFKLALDCNPNLSRAVVMKPVTCDIPEISAVYFGASNAHRLADASAAFIKVDTVTTGGWALTTANVTITLPELTALCDTLPPESPVVIYCLDNTAFLAADGDGTLTPIAKLADDGYHVVGELVVAHEAALAAAVNNIKRLLAVCGDRLVIVVTPLPRYLNKSCCADVSHCIHRLIPDFAYKILDDLQRLHQFVKGKLSSFPKVQVISAGDLLTGNSNPSHESLLAAYSGWGAVHGNAAAYTRMALTLVDLLKNDGKISMLPPSLKRPRSASSSSSSSSQGQRIPVIGPPPSWNKFLQPAGRGRGRGGRGNGSAYF